RGGTERFLVEPQHIGHVAISNDGKTAATGPGSREPRDDRPADSDVFIRIWNTETGRVTREIPVEVGQPSGPPMVYAPDGKHLVYPTSGRMVVADVETGKSVHQWPLPGIAAVTALAIASDGKTLYTGHADG